LPAGCDDTFTKMNDVFASTLTTSIANNIERTSGIKPYTELAIIDRKYVDHNREKKCAFEKTSLRAKRAYEDYHNGIRLKIEEMVPTNENDLAFLFDIHGARQELITGQLFDVLIGTDEDHSIHALAEIDPNVWGSPNGLIRLLQGKGIVVYPPDPAQTKDPHSLDGGYTIEKYGSKGKKGLVAIQMEVSRSIREDRSSREKFAAHTADCILQFIKPFN
jgi:N-formylglutamate amidohydrolase